MNPKNTTKLKHTRVESKTIALPTDRTSGLRVYIRLVCLAHYFKIWTVHGLYSNSRPLNLF
jgi:hypothetical protein